MKHLYLLSGLLFYSWCSLKAQSVAQLSMPDDTTIFHKLAKTEDAYWALDYGNGRVYKSMDTGHSWNLMHETGGEFMEAIQFINEDVGYLCGDFGIIQKTVNGGETWIEIGPTYAPRIIRSDLMEGDTNAINRYFYQMYFKSETKGLVWGFEFRPALGWKSRTSFFYETNDGGTTWDRIDYRRGEFDGIVESFLRDAEWNASSAMGIYRHEDKIYKIGRQSVTQGTINWDSSMEYPLPPMPDSRFMLRTMHFLNDHQGYILGGNLTTSSRAYILETLDGGRSWRHMPTELPHIHYSLEGKHGILMSGKDGLLQRWTPKIKSDSSFVHQADASRILLDGQIGPREWSGANRVSLREGIDLYTLQDEHFLYLSLQYDTSQYSNYYCDLFFAMENDTLLNIHASQQLGERRLTGDTWTESDPPFQWGYTSDWTSNSIRFDRTIKKFIPYQALEFQIAKSKLPADKICMALQTRDLNWENAAINLPPDGNFKDQKDWMVIYLR